MAITTATYAAFLDYINNTLTAENLEAYLAANPGATYPPPPDPSYAELLPLARDQFQDLLDSSSAVVAAVLTTGTSGGTLGRATINYPGGMATPVVLVSVIDATENNVYFQAVIESVGSNSATVRVTQNTSATVLGISLLTVPTLAAGATVHVLVYDAG